LTNALLAQNIATEVGKIELEEGNLLLIKLTIKKTRPKPWILSGEKEGGLMLKPDWSYPEGSLTKF
jgi:hypothetical protein